MVKTDLKTCAFVTLGCKVNQYDTQAIRETVRADGYTEVAPTELADLYVINTCTVTGQSGAKSRKQIRQLQRRNPNARVVVTGCYAESDREALEALGGIDVIASNANKFSIPALLAGREPEPVGIGSIAEFAGHTRAFLKVEDGCELNCTFCIIPKVRGPVRSKPLPDAVAEVRRLAASGHKEIVLTGIHLGAYGEDLPDQTLPGLITAIDPIAGIERIRLSSIEANEVDDSLLAVLSASKKACEHFHLPLQSGDDTVLKRMRRQYTVKIYEETVEMIKTHLENPAFTTDVIVGFPGETDEQFENTLTLCKKIGYTKIHVFPYSVRAGTPAARMSDFVPPKLLEQRVQKLLALSDSLGLAYRQTLVGTEQEILLERGDGADAAPVFSGLTRRYGRVVVDNGAAAIDNRLMRARIVSAGPTLLYGSVS